MKKQTVFPSFILCNLADCFQKRKTFNIPGCTSDLTDHDIGSAFLLCLINEILYFIGNMRNNLYSFPQVFSFPLFIQDIPVYLSRCHI